MEQAEQASAERADAVPAPTLSPGFVEEFESRYPDTILQTLLKDRTTGKNIKWADVEYEALGEGYGSEDEIALAKISGTNSGVLKPRVSKAQERQSRRTKTRAEVFTPSWLVNSMANALDREWFRHDGAFNVESENGRGWEPSEQPVRFPKTKGRGWHAYVESPRLEITCGEAPFLFTRYDAVTGEAVPVKRRVGVLDRKLRIVSDHAGSYKTWATWALRALKATYGYEFQGDNLLIARMNAMETFREHCFERWGIPPDLGDLEKAAWVVSWNLWQMDGLTCAVPTLAKGAPVQSALFEWDAPKPEDEVLQPTITGFDELEFGGTEEAASADEGQALPLCVIYDWENDRPIEFASLKGEVSDGMKKFYAVIGNPPYQEETEGNGRSNPLYNSFMDASYEVSDLVELITPGRFLFNAGQTSRTWNERMLSDKHLKVLKYETDATVVFPGTDIKGGVAITLHNAIEDYGAIEIFTAYPELNSIIKRVNKLEGERERLDSLFASQRLYKFSDTFFEEFKDDPNAQFFLGTGTRNKILSSAMQKMPEVFVDKKESGPDEIRFLGRIDNKRQWRCIKRKYLKDNEYLDAYKLLIPEANNSGKFGETLADPLIGHPGEGTADTFLNAGPFDNEKEPENFRKYYKTKFFRALLGARKVTQHSPSQVWRTIPLQDFTASSDIDWSQSIADIDKQLYEKYGLSEDEIAFIESHVKEMS